MTGLEHDAEIQILAEAMRYKYQNHVLSLSVSLPDAHSHHYPRQRYGCLKKREIQETQFACSLSACNCYRDHSLSSVTAVLKYLISQLHFANGRNKAINLLGILQASAAAHGAENACCCTDSVAGAESPSLG